MQQFQTTHPESGLCIHVQVDENHQVIRSCYDNSEPVNLHYDGLKDILQAEADNRYGTETVQGYQFQTTHPVTSEDVRVIVDEDRRVTEAYFDDAEEVDLQQEGVRAALQAAADQYYHLP